MKLLIPIASLCLLIWLGTLHPHKVNTYGHTEADMQKFYANLETDDAQDLFNLSNDDLDNGARLPEDML